MWAAGVNVFAQAELLEEVRREKGTNETREFTSKSHFASA